MYKKLLFTHKTLTLAGSLSHKHLIQGLFVLFPGASFKQKAAIHAIWGLFIAFN